MSQLQSDDLGTQSQRLLGQVLDLLGFKDIDHAHLAHGAPQLVVSLWPQHVEHLLHAGHEQVRIWQGKGKDGPPVGPATGLRWVGHGHVEAGGCSLGLGPLEEAAKLVPAIGIHASHDGRVAEMKETGLAQEAGGHVFGAESLVGPRVV